MTLDDAARKLAAQVRAPRWAVSISAWHGDDGEKILVRVDQRYRGDLGAVPERFEGFAVKVVWRSEFTTALRRAI